MMKTTSFKRKLIASAIATSALSGWSYTAQAQEGESPTRGEDSQVFEEILVTGIRASVQRSLDRKRFSQGVVDAISAEDMGDFPDTNLAESLQRITGVSIDRRDGEGSKVTVRGLGPDFNLVTLNGRQMPGASLNATTASGSRSFDFANLASEGVAAVEVYKTGRADMPSGGMGATINIITPKPLTATPTRSLSVKGVLDESRSDADITPEISGIFTDNFFDGKFGVAVTASYQEREGTTSSASVGNGFFDHAGTTIANDTSGERFVDFPDGLTVDFNNGNNHINVPGPDDFFSVPQSIDYSTTDFQRTRTNAQVTLQFSPVESLVTTLDYTYSENEIESETNTAGFWFAGQEQNSIFTDFESPAVQSPLLISDAAANDIAFGAGRNSTLFENESIGFNVKWEATDRLRFTLDAHSSSAEAGPDSPFGTNALVAQSAFVRARTTGSFVEDNPSVFLDLERPRLDENGDAVLDDNFRPIRDPIDAVGVQDLQVSGSFFRNAETDHDIDQVQFDTQWDITDWAQLELGGGIIRGSFDSAFSNVQNDTWGGVGDPGQFVGEGFFTEDGFLGKVDGDFDEELTEQEAAVMQANNTQAFNQFLRADFIDIRNFAAENFDTGTGPAECFDGATQFCSQPFDNFNSVEEDIDYVFVSANIERRLFDRFDWSLNLGFRYEETDVESPGNRQSFSQIVWVAPNELTMDQIGSDLSPFQADYDVTLPNVDFKFNLRENLVLRASWNESLTRPLWTQIVGGESFSELVRVDGGDGSSTNPGLSPIQSENFDLSVEWYYGNGSAVTIAYFEKTINDFITTAVSREQALPGQVNPAQGERAQAAIDAGAEGSEEIRQFIFDNFADPETAFLDANEQINIVGIPGEDPEAFFNIQKPLNGPNGDVDGLEVAISHNFWDTGFGVIANYTKVEADKEFDNFGLSNEPQFAIPGVSDTANLIAFYDKHGFQARIAYNWRDDFLATAASQNGNNPINVDSFAQIDLNVSYDITDSLNVFLEGINVNDARAENFGRADEQVIGVFESGPRYQLGVRYKF